MSHDAKTNEEFYALLKKADKSLVDFHATWCGPCVRIAPYVANQCAQKGINLIKVNVDELGDISHKYGIQAMPTFQVIDKNGNKLFEKCGGSEAVVNECIGKCQ